MKANRMQSATTLVELLRARVETEEDRRAYVYLEEGTRVAGELSFRDLDRRARAIGAELQARSMSGRRVLLLYPSGLEFVTAFCGCMYAGAIAVPAPASEASQLERALQRLSAVADDAEPSLVLTTSEQLEAVRSLAGKVPALASVEVLASDTIADERAQAWVDPHVKPDDLAFLQYTSGSTSRPKGVVISHGNLLYTAADIDAGWRYDRDSVMVSWLPIFHDMGLICGIVLPVVRGFACILMSPLAFVQKPLRWLQAIHDYRATHSAAPNFAYELCVRKISPEQRAKLDLSCWDVTLSSAEPVRFETMRRFHEAFAPAGFRWEVFCPGFGLAEATVKVTASRRGDEPRIAWVDAKALEQNKVVALDPEQASTRARARPIVGNGSVELETKILIVDPESLRPSPAGQVGEIWVHGPCIAKGYWKLPEATRETFEAKLAEVPSGLPEGPWMRTGDLGFCERDGELFVTGRRKDLLILRGRNVYPQDVEAEAEAADRALRPGCGAAFSIDVDGEERLVLVQEVEPKRAGDLSQVLQAVRARLGESLELDVFALLLVGPREVPKTSSGKVQRKAAKAQFEALGFEPLRIEIPSWAAPGDRSEHQTGKAEQRAADEAWKSLAEAHLRWALGAALELEPGAFEPAQELAQRGLSFALAAKVNDHLRRLFEVGLEPGAFMGQPTLDDLACELALVLEGKSLQDRDAAVDTTGDFTTMDPDSIVASKPSTVQQPGDRISAAAQASASDLEDWLCATLAKNLGISAADIDVERPFAQFGLDSLKAVDLVEELEEHLGVELSATLTWDYPTVETLAAHLVTLELQPSAGGEAREPQASGEPFVGSGAENSTAENMVAIVGVGCRFPGANGPDAYWNLLRDGVDAITEVPAQRFDIDSWYDEHSGTPGKLSTRFGGFLDQVDQFDATFFGISAREAARMDPQQRILLETAWEALEHAGQSADALRGRDVGVFVGVGSADYVRMQLSNPAAIDAYAGTGNAYSIAANRISYALDLRGPSMTVDTACSSSLVSLHLARKSLLAGECSVALAGGVNLILSPEWTIAFSHAEMMAADGRCKAFDSRADGYVRGEGCGFVVLKRLADAQRDNDRILCVVRGSALNQDGHSNGITAPNGLSQQAVIRAALKDARVDAAAVDYVEAHGTGTKLGDPIEAEALQAVYGEVHSKSAPLLVGSVKTNIGHLEAAAGVASIIKMALSFERGLIPQQLHLGQVNPHIDMERSALEFASRARPWPRAEKARLAGVSSFGFGGTNAHVLLEEAPPVAKARNAVDRPRHAVCLSAPDEDRLRAAATRLDDYLGEHPELDLGDVAYTLNTGRAHGRERFATSAESIADLRAQLEALASEGNAASLAAGRDVLGTSRGRVDARARARVAFLFTGQGAQYAGMGRALFDSQPAYRRALVRCDEILRPLLEVPLLEVMFDPASSELLDQTAYTQPALFALEWALYEMWTSFGLQPVALAGHSIGEYTAACAAGVFELEDALRLVAERGRLMQSLPAGGAMAAVMSDPETVQAALAGTDLVIAAYNGPRNTVVSGEKSAVEALTKRLQAEGLRAVGLTVSHAFHSPLMDPALAEFRKVAQSVQYHAPKLPLASNLAGGLFESGRAPDADYWTKHLREPVRFTENMQALARAGCNTFLELGPHPALTEMGRRTLSSDPELTDRWHSSLRRGQDDWRIVSDSLGRLFVQGVGLNWEGVDRDFQRLRVHLPSAVFRRRSYWMGEQASAPSTTTMTDFEQSPSEQPQSTLEGVLALFRAQTETLLRLAGSLDPADRQRLEAIIAGSTPLGAGAVASAPTGPGAGRREQSGSQAPGDAAQNSGPITRELVQQGVLAQVARISNHPVSDLALHHHLNGDLGFDSLMTVDLDRALRRIFPDLTDSERMFTEDIAIDELVSLLCGNLQGDRSMEFLTEHQKEKKTYAEYADLIEMDPEKTYVGGAFKDEAHTIHSVHCDGRSISGRMDMQNKYAGTASFHLTQMGAYSFIVQLIQGYLCYKYGITKDSMGMPRLREIDMRWNGMVRKSSGIYAKVEEKHCTSEDNVFTVELSFDLEDGACSGRIIGICPLTPHPDAIQASQESLTPFQKEVRDYATQAELIGMDPRETYQGGVFKDEVHRIHEVELEGRVITGKMDVTNKYSEMPTFHLTQMGAYSYIVQLLIGYLCYKHGVNKELLGMPTLREFSIRWKEMVPYPTAIPCRVEERACSIENGRYKIEFGFEIGDDHGRGRLVGLIPVPPDTKQDA